VSAEKAPKTVVVTKAAAARSQLDTAIMLWFNYGDPVSICALAYAAQDCYAALSVGKKKSSIYKDWFESQPKGFQRRTRDILNFFKHGPMNPSGKVRLPLRLGEILISDSINCHENVCGDTSHLMELFTIRFALENPGVVPIENRLMYAEGAEIEELRKRDRPTFLNESEKALREAGFLSG
jgi:hypothetical protein